MVFRLGNGAKVTRVFGQEETIETLYNYIWAKYNNKFYLTNAKTKHVLDDLTIPIFALEDEGLVNIFVN